MFKAYPETSRPLIEFHEVLLRGPSPFTEAERELIAAYVSGLNHCRYCHGVHTATAESLGIEAGAAGQLIEAFEQGPVADEASAALRRDSHPRSQRRHQNPCGSDTRGRHSVSFSFPCLTVYGASAVASQPGRQEQATAIHVLHKLRHLYTSLFARAVMPSWFPICRFCVCDGVPKRSLYVSLIVGTILNLINQGDALLDGSDLNLTKLVLTFLVPYCVATYGAVSYRLAPMRRESDGSGI